MGRGEREGAETVKLKRPASVSFSFLDHKASTIESLVGVPRPPPPGRSVLLVSKMERDVLPRFSRFTVSLGKKNNRDKGLGDG
jgi:hypothetical protein